MSIISDEINKYNLGHQPNCFGPRTWRYLFAQSLVFPVNPSESAVDIFSQNLKYTLLTIPCASCNQHAKEYVEENTPSFASRESYFYWLWNFQNTINVRLNKPCVSLEDAFVIHTSNESKQQSKMFEIKIKELDMYFIIVLIFLILGGLLFYASKNRKRKRKTLKIKK